MHFPLVQAAYESVEEIKPNTVVLGFDGPSGNLLGDWLGVKKALSDHGFNCSLGYLNQIAYNAGGGYDRHKKAAYIDQFAFTFTQDLEQYTGIANARIEGNIVNRNHDNNLTADRLQNPRVPFNDLAQESWGGGSVTRLGWLTFYRTFLDEKLSWRIGMMNKVLDFDKTIPCDFQTLNLCGGKSAGSFTWFNWNVHYWGTTFQYRVTDQLTVKSGVMEQNPQAPSREHAWNGSTRGTKGVLLPLELEWRPEAGIYNLALLYTNVKRGVYDSQQEGGMAKNKRNTLYLYGGFNQQLTKHGNDATRGLSLSYSFSIADQSVTPAHYVTSVSLRYRGLLDSRPEDWIALGTSYVKTGNRLKSEQRKINDVALDDSSNTELYYRIKAASWLELQPSLQYWHNPGAMSSTSDAWVLGFKTIVNF